MGQPNIVEGREKDSKHRHLSFFFFASIWIREMNEQATLWPGVVREDLTKLVASSAVSKAPSETLLNISAKH